MTISRDHADYLCRLSEDVLLRMYSPEQKRFCYREVWTSDNRSRLEGVSFRYSAIATLGILNARARGHPSHWDEFEIERIAQSMYAERNNVPELGDWGLLLWMLSESCCDLAESVFEEITAGLQNNRWQIDASGAMELSFLLSGMVAYSETRAPATEAEGLTHSVYRSLISRYCAPTGLFFGVPKRGSLPQTLRKRISSFASQIYSIYAIARYYRLVRSQEALEIARTCACQLISLQTPAGGWCWQYDVYRGEVVETYPIYSVHQYGMAPMALLLLDQVSSGKYEMAIQHGLQWLQGRNELGNGMVDTSKPIIWRAIRRRGPNRASLSAVTNSALAIMGLKSNFQVSTGFTLVRESRPYCLGWLLLAWA